MINPFHPRSWSYQFWQEGYNAKTWQENPYEFETFPHETWLDGYIASHPGEFK